MYCYVHDYKYAPNLESLLTQQYVCVMCTLWSDNTCVFTRFHSVKNANTQLIWSSVVYLVFVGEFKKNVTRQTWRALLHFGEYLFQSTRQFDECLKKWFPIPPRSRFTYNYDLITPLLREHPGDVFDFLNGNSTLHCHHLCV